jgi:L-alanine-DL-glutamate epimerase-like enolase superfamily enzyme
LKFAEPSPSIAIATNGNLDRAVVSARVSAFTIPTEQPESDGTAQWSSTTLVTVELTAGGATSLGYSYADETAAALCEKLLRSVVIGGDAFAIPEIHLAMDRFTRNMGRPGIASCSIAAIDNSLWDLKARLLQLPLASLLGKLRDGVPAYGSGGFTSFSEKQLVHQLTGWADEGMRSVKMKIGTHPEQDVDRVKVVQKALKGTAELFVDANGAYHRKQALTKAGQFADLGVTWFEEPVTSDDRIGLHLLVENAPTPLRIAAGEYTYVLDDARELIDSQAVDVLQADVTRCGGITNFLKIAHLAEICHIPFSAHTSPSIHTSICCALPSVINIEYFADHARIESMLFDGARKPVKGDMKPDLSRPGLGIDLKRSEAEKFKVFSANVEMPGKR